MNNENIGNLLKAHMEYTEERNACSNCLYYQISVVNTCTYNRAYFFTVRPEGICKHWEKNKAEEINKNLSGTISGSGTSLSLLTYKYESYPKINIIESGEDKADPDILDIL